MTKISKYVCDGCCKEYDNESDCRKCENSHKQFISGEFTYTPNENYPICFEATFEDGRIISYYRKSF